MNVLPLRQPVPDRGRLLTPETVAHDWFGDAVSAQWVRRNVRPKVRLGHNTVLYYEADVRAWIARRREEVA